MVKLTRWGRIRQTKVADTRAVREVSNTGAEGSQDQTGRKLIKKQIERCLKTWCLKTQVWYRTACWLCSSITEDKDQCTVGSAPQSVQQRMRQMHAKVQWIAHSPDHSVISSWAFEDYQFFYQFSVTVRANCPWKHHGCNSQTWKKHIKIMLIIRATDATVFNSSRYVPLQSSCCCSCCPFLSPIFAQYINS